MERYRPRTTPDPPTTNRRPPMTGTCSFRAGHAWERKGTMSNGFHRVLIRATLAALVGATAWGTPANAADGTAPKVSVTAPTAGQAISGTVTLSASASDDVGVQAVKWYVDGSEVAYDADGAPWARSW